MKMPARAGLSALASYEPQATLGLRLRSGDDVFESLQARVNAALVHQQRGADQNRVKSQSKNVASIGGVHATLGDFDCVGRQTIDVFETPGVGRMVARRAQPPKQTGGGEIAGKTALKISGVD